MKNNLEKAVATQAVVKLCSQYFPFKWPVYGNLNSHKMTFLMTDDSCENLVQRGQKIMKQNITISLFAARS